MARVVYLSGCWDLFHVGHLWAIQHARAAGDFLVVGCNTDEYIRNYKSNGPIIPYEQRRAILEALPWVDAVVPHGSTEDMTGFKKYGVNVRAYGPDYAVLREQTAAARRKCWEERRVLSGSKIEAYHIPWAPQEVSTTKIKEKVKCLLQNELE